MTRYKFDEQQCQEIWQQYDQEKLSTTDLAEVWQTTHSTISRCIYRAGGKLRDAAALQVNIKRKLTNAQGLQAIEMSKAGKTQKQIAAKFGVSMPSIARTFRRLGYKPPSHGEVQRRLIGMSDEQLAEAVELHKSGWGYLRIGKHLGFTATTIRRYLVKEGLMAPIKRAKPVWFDEAVEMRKSGMTLKEVANAIGVGTGTICRHFDYQGVKRRGLNRLSPSQELEAVRMYVDDGIAVKDIEAHFGLSNLSLYAILTRHGAKSRRSADGNRKFDAEQQREIARMYQLGKPSCEIAAQFGASPSTIYKILLESGTEIRDSDNPTDSVQHLLDGTGRFEGEARECGFYVADLINYPSYCKPGIAYDYGQRADDEYSNEPELELRFGSRQEAFFLEQAVLDATRANKGCPEELQGWIGCTEVRHMEAADLSDIAIRLADELEELGLWEFAIRYAPMTASQVAVCQMKSRIEVA